MLSRMLSFGVKRASGRGARRVVVKDSMSAEITNHPSTLSLRMGHSLKETPYQGQLTPSQSPNTISSQTAHTSPPHPKACHCHQPAVPLPNLNSSFHPHHLVSAARDFDTCRAAWEILCLHYGCHCEAHSEHQVAECPDEDTDHVDLGGAAIISSQMAYKEPVDKRPKTSKAAKHGPKNCSLLELGWVRWMSQGGLATNGVRI
ncbi:hypothetical protein BDZ91DRAFT_750213 [Kalaharituber pfeilii]|nr:hypothetical protein BDZ91DRAFT_750213 [Kalaharituber pfeilii]